MLAIFDGYVNSGARSLNLLKHQATLNTIVANQKKILAKLK